MAHRAPSGRAPAPAPAPSRRLARRVLVLFTLSLSCSYLCYSLLCCCGGPAAPRARCAPARSAAAKKLLQKSRPCGRPPPAEPPAPARRLRDPPAPPPGSPPGPARPGAKRLPQAIVVGVKKGGTRAVLEFIRVHPDVRALGTEPHFFDRNYDRGLEWYRAPRLPEHSPELRLQPAKPQPCLEGLRYRDGYGFPISPEDAPACVMGPRKQE